MSFGSELKFEHHGPFSCRKQREDEIRDRISVARHSCARRCRERLSIRPRQLAIQIVQELRRPIDAGHTQMVAGTGAGHIEQMPLGLVDFFEVGIGGGRLFSITAPRNPPL
jgi:hypothetical protein